MDGMNQNNNGNNPYGQPDNMYRQPDSPYGQPGDMYGQPNDPYNHNPYQQGNPGNQVIRPYEPGGNRKKISSGVIIGIVCAVVAVLGIGVGAMAYFRSTPSYKVAKGLENLAAEFVRTGNPLSDKLGMDEIMQMMQEDGGHVRTRLDCTANEISQGITLGVDMDYYKDMRGKELSADTTLSMMNVDLVHLGLYANDEVFCFSVPELYLEDMYIGNENVVSQYNSSVFGQIYPLDMEDFTIDLFADGDGKLSVRDWKNLSSSMGDLEDKLEACREAMTIDKAGKGLYRVSFPAKESDRLLKSLMNSIYGEEDLEEMWFMYDYDKLITSDVSFLFEIGGKNRIESIMLEEPVEMLDGEASVEGEIFFLGEKKSVDMIQGKLAVSGLDGETREVICQLQQTSDSDTYNMDMDLKWVQANETLWKMNLVTECDASSDEFDVSCTFRDETDDVEFIMAGSFDDIVKGESIDLALDEVSFAVDGEDYLKITGDISVEPLSGGVRTDVKPTTAFFEMTEADLLEIIYKLNDDLGLLDYLW